MSKRLDYNQIAPAGLKALGGGHGYVAQSSLPAQLSQIVQRVRDGRLRTNIGNIATLDDAVAAFNRTERRKGKTIIRVRPRATRAHRCTRPAGAVQIGRLRPMAPGPWFRKYATPSDLKSIACSVI